MLRIPSFFTRPLALLLTICAPAWAAAGEIHGHIFISDHHPAPGATATIRQSGATAAAGPDGSYSFMNLAPGSYDLVFADASGRQAQSSVTVTSDRPVSLDANLDESVVVMQKLQVKGDYMPPDIARATQESAPNLVNLVTAADFRKLPDVNAAEAVRRLPGIALETDTGEGRYVNIRGLDADLNSTTFGGVRLPPTNIATPLGGGRAVAMDAIPAGVISSITVTKTNRPDQDAEALGGTIEITPKVVPENGRPFVEGHLGTGKEPLRNTGIFDGELTFGGRFGGTANGKDGSWLGNGPFSFLASVTAYNDGRGVDDAETGFQDAQSSGVPDKAFSAFEQRYYQYHRHRYGYAAQIGFEPNQQHSWFLRYNQFGYTEYINRQRLILSNLDNGAGLTDAAGNTLPAFQLDPGHPNAIIAPAAIYQKTLRDDEEHTKSQVAVLGGKDDFNLFSTDYHVSFSEGSFHKPHDYNSTFSNPTPAVVEYDNTTDPNFPVYKVLSGPNPANPSGYAMTGFTNSTEDDRDREWGGVLNLTVPTHWLPDGKDQLKFGGSARLRDRVLGITTQNYSSVPDASLSSVLIGGDKIFYDKHYNNGPNINNLDIRNLFFGQNSQFTPLLGIEQANALIGHQKDTENVYAGYAEYEFSFGNLGVLAGVRFEQTHAVYRANQVATDADGNLLSVSPISQTNDYNDFFPTLQLKYSLRPNLIARLSFSTAIARPGFNQVSAATSINPGADTVQTGNPNLKPTTGQNYDAAIEYYLPQGGIASVGIFDKEFKNYIANRVENGVFFPNNGVFAGFTGAARVITFLNVPSARARGAELNYQQQFVRLPGAFGGLGINANYTYVDSSAELHPGEKSVMPSTSKNVYNAGLFFDKYGLNLSLSASFIGKNIFGVGGSAATDTWSQDRFNLDFGGSYAFTEHFTYYLNVKNLTDTAMKFTEGKGDNRVIQREFYGPTIQTGVRFTF